MEPQLCSVYRLLKQVTISNYICNESAVGYKKVKYVKDLPPIEETTKWPRVSIIMAARNEDKDIEDAVKSFLNQNYPDFELIVVNDRSTDNTLPILQRLQQSHPGITICNQSN